MKIRFVRHLIIYTCKL